MNIGDIQTFLRSLGVVLKANQGGKPATEFEAFCTGLEPFKELAIGTFSQFLRDADEYKRTGIVPVTEPKKGRGAKASARKPAAPKVKPKSKNDVEAIQAAVKRLQGLYERFADPTLTAAVIDAEVDRTEKEFDGDGLKAVAKAFGITGGLKSKAAAKEKIRERIVERKDRYERSEAFSAGSNPAAPTPKAPLPEAEPLVEEVIE